MGGSLQHARCTACKFRLHIGRWETCVSQAVVCLFGVALVGGPGAIQGCRPVDAPAYVVLSRCDLLAL